jgi:hypothetical protein
MEPGAELRFTAEGLQLGPTPDEHGLGPIGGVVLTEHPAGQVVDPRTVPPVEPLKGPFIPPLGEEDISAIVL